jgi:hypothetical protein
MIMLTNMTLGAEKMNSQYDNTKSIVSFFESGEVEEPRKDYTWGVFFYTLQGRVDVVGFIK